LTSPVEVENNNFPYRAHNVIMPLIKEKCIEIKPRNYVLLGLNFVFELNNECKYN